MAWWQEIIKNYRAGPRISAKAKARARASRSKAGKAKSLSAGLTRATQKYFYDNFVDLLYVSLSVFTYLYILLSAITFAFQGKGPAGLLAYAMDTLSEPYLGALAIYVLVKEIERRRLGGKDYKRRRGELFVVLWLSFLLSATFVTFFSDSYHLNKIYQTIVTNSLAAMIIRIGSLLR